MSEEDAFVTCEGCKRAEAWSSAADLIEKAVTLGAFPARKIATSPGIATSRRPKFLPAGRFVS